MAYPVQMVNRVTGEQTLGFSGFSWTCFFFGPFPALFRGHIVAFFCIFALALCTIGLSNFIFMFTYNGWHYNWLMKKGFAAVGAHQHAPQNIFNVSVGNVGTADHSQQAHFQAAQEFQARTPSLGTPQPVNIGNGAVRSLPRS